MFEGDNPSKCTARSVVFLDEAGLPSEANMALKVIHYPMGKSILGNLIFTILDRSYVSTVILSNKLLDAAKLNRALQVLQSAPSATDYLELAKGCLFGNNPNISQQNRAIIDALCHSFKECSRKFTISEKEEGQDKSRSMFHLRDFVYFLRYLGKHSHRGVDSLELSADVLLRGLQRNFNGIPKHEFFELVEIFFNRVSDAVKVYGPKWEIPRELKTTSSVDLIKRSLADNLGNFVPSIQLIYHLEENENPNTSAFRYIMVIDPTDTEASITLLNSLKLTENKLNICYVGDFVENANEFVHNEVILKVTFCHSKYIDCQDQNSNGSWRNSCSSQFWTYSLFLL